jgi:hypothetical protein
MESLNGYTKVTHVWEIGRREISPTINKKREIGKMTKALGKNTK